LEQANFSCASKRKHIPQDTLIVKNQQYLGYNYAIETNI